MSQSTMEQNNSDAIDIKKEPRIDLHWDTMAHNMYVYKDDPEMQLAYSKAMKSLHGPCNTKYADLMSRLVYNDKKWNERTKTLRRWSLEEENMDDDGNYKSGNSSADGAGHFNKSFVLAFQDEECNWHDENACSQAEMSRVNVALPNTTMYRIICQDPTLLDKFARWMDAQIELNELEEFMWGFVAAL